MTFREDESRIRDRTLADNISWIRRFTITLAKASGNHRLRKHGKSLTTANSLDHFAEFPQVEFAGGQERNFIDLVKIQR